MAKNKKPAAKAAPAKPKDPHVDDVDYDQPPYDEAEERCT